MKNIRHSDEGRNPVTNNLDLWTSTYIKKSTAGRGSNGKQEAYGIKKLRELILELTVRGKLVPQDPNDEPASVLLEKIAKEKALWIKKGKNKKQKILSEIWEEEIPYELPIGWEWARLGDIGEIFNGNSISASVKEAKYTGLNAGLPFIATKDVGYGWQGLDYANGVTIPEEEPSFKIAHKGSVLICAEGGSAGKKCGITKQNICFGNKLFAIELYGDIEPNYLLANYLSPTFFAQFSEKMTGIIGGISLAKLKLLLIPIPSIEEQHRIVAKVDELMSLCDQLEEQQTDSLEAHQTLVETLLGTLTNVGPQEELTEAWNRIANHFDTLFTTEQSIDQLKQTILQLAVMGKLVPQDPNDEPASVLLEKIAVEKEQLIKKGIIKRPKKLLQIREAELPFKVPQSWKWARVWDIAKVITSGSRDWAKYYSDKGAIFVTMGNLSRGDYKLRMESLRYVKAPKDSEGLRTRLEEKDLLVSITGDVGNLGLIPKNFGEAYINQHTCLLRFMLNCQNRYFPEFMRTPLAKFQFDTPQRGVKNSFRLGDVGEMIIPIPPPAEQHRIVAKVDELMALCDTLKDRLNNAQTTQVHLADVIVKQAVNL